MKSDACFICCQIVSLTDFNYCTCKMSICGPCLVTWNTYTDPRLLCPVCRNCYGINRPILFHAQAHWILFYGDLAKYILLILLSLIAFWICVVYLV